MNFILLKIEVNLSLYFNINFILGYDVLMFLNSLHSLRVFGY